MKYLLSKELSIEEFNDNLKEGLEQGIILSDSNSIDFIKDLYNNLTQYFRFFIEASKINKDEIQNRK